jgi:hypothetical protein
MAGFDVLTAVTVGNAIFLIARPCISVDLRITGCLEFVHRPVF